ncbi:hypothetical protein ABPG73_004681 [Tetrahymena malaccensis]
MIYSKFDFFSSHFTFNTGNQQTKRGTLFGTMLSLAVFVITVSYFVYLEEEIESNIDQQDFEEQVQQYDQESKMDKEKYNDQPVIIPCFENKQKVSLEQDLYNMINTNSNADNIISVQNNNQMIDNQSPQHINNQIILREQNNINIKSNNITDTESIIQTAFGVHNKQFQRDFLSFNSSQNASLIKYVLNKQQNNQQNLINEKKAIQKINIQSSLVKNFNMIQNANYSKEIKDDVLKKSNNPLLKKKFEVEPDLNQQDLQQQKYQLNEEEIQTNQENQTQPEQLNNLGNKEIKHFYLRQNILKKQQTIESPVITLETKEDDQMNGKQEYLFQEQQGKINKHQVNEEKNGEFDSQSIIPKFKSKMKQFLDNDQQSVDCQDNSDNQLYQLNIFDNMQSQSTNPKNQQIKLLQLSQTQSKNEQNEFTMVDSVIEEPIQKYDSMQQPETNQRSQKKSNFNLTNQEKDKRQNDELIENKQKKNEYLDILQVIQNTSSDDRIKQSISQFSLCSKKCKNTVKGIKFYEQDKIEEQIERDVDILSFFQDVLFLKKAIMLLLKEDQLASLQMVGCSQNFLKLDLKNIDNHENKEVQQEYEQQTNQKVADHQMEEKKGGEKLNDENEEYGVYQQVVVPSFRSKQKSQIDQDYSCNIPNQISNSNSIEPLKGMESLVSSRTRSVLCKFNSYQQNPTLYINNKEQNLNTLFDSIVENENQKSQASQQNESVQTESQKLFLSPLNKKAQHFFKKTELQQKDESQNKREEINQKQDLKNKLLTIHNTKFSNQIKPLISNLNIFCGKRFERRIKGLNPKEQYQIQEQIENDLDILNYFKDMLFLKKAIMLLLTEDQLASLQLVGCSQKFLELDFKNIEVGENYYDKLNSLSPFESQFAIYQSKFLQQQYNNKFIQRCANNKKQMSILDKKILLSIQKTLNI